MHDVEGLRLETARLVLRPTQPGDLDASIPVDVRGQTAGEWKARRRAGGEGTC